MNYFVTTHKAGSAGHFFDRSFSEKNNLTLISASSESIEIRKVIVKIILKPWLVFWYGPIGALAMVRYDIAAQFESTVCKNEVIWVSRALFIPKNRFSVLWHNNECLYYYEEAKAENSILLALIYYWQCLCCKIHEKKVIKSAEENHFLSKVEHRYYLKKYKGVLASAGLDRCGIGIPKPLNITTRKAILGTDSQPIFFGDFSNSRNHIAAKYVLNEYPNALLFGKNSSLFGPASRGMLSLSDAPDNYVLVIPPTSRCGLQTKLVHWSLASKRFIAPNFQRLAIFGGHGTRY